MSRPVADVFRFPERAFFPDAWHVLGADEALPAGGHVFVPLARLQADPAALAAVNGPLGLLLAPADDVEAIAADLGRFAAIAVAFPVFTDGRGFSHARLLRERLGFTGELRAVGDVLLDQIPFMLRCGFDAFAISHAPTRRALEAGHLPEVGIYLQPVGARPEAAIPGRPWLRRGQV